MKITLTILKEDIEAGNYMNPEECPITKALARAGYPHLKDRGLSIRNEAWKKVTTYRNRDYKALSDRVCSMHIRERNRKANQSNDVLTVPETFTATIEVADESDSHPESHTNIQDFN